MSELLARLNTPHFRLTVGSGGIPDITTQDIAAALGMVRNRFGADVLAYLHCPNMLNETEFQVELMKLVRDESVRVNEAAQREIDEATNQAIAYFVRNIGRRSARNAPDPDKCKPTTWPAFKGQNMERYYWLVISVLAEYKTGVLCRPCNGSGLVSVAASAEARLLLTVSGLPLTGKCRSCDGTGIHPEPQRSRAARMKVTQPVFQRNWTEPYRWLLSGILASADAANQEFRAALGRKAA